MDWSSFFSFLRRRGLLLLFCETKHLVALAAANTDAGNKNEWREDKDGDQSTSDSSSGGQSIIKVSDVGQIEWIWDSFAHCNV